MWYVEIVCAFNGCLAFSKNILSLLAGNVLPWKKRSALLNGVWYFVKKYSKSFGGKNLFSLLTDLSHQKKTMLWLAISPLFESAEIFFFSATLHSQKIAKEIAYISASYQAPLKARIFFIFVVNNKRKKTIIFVVLLFLYLYCSLIRVQLFIID